MNMGTLRQSRGYASLVLLLASLAFLPVGALAESGRVGGDLIPAFRRASQGGSLRCAVIGGSITQAGKGWIGDWLRAQFPGSTVFVVNAGMSATGSALGIFRLERDVIACQPDLVLIEFAVNDQGAPDEETIRNLESIVVRLKTLPNPPAVVFAETAARKGVNLARHRRIARHYGLLEIDLQAASDEYLKQNNLPWSALFSDDVHATDRGNAFYSEVIAKQLQPFVDEAKTNSANTPESGETVGSLPKPLSNRPLLLDGQLIPLRSAFGWETETSLPNWWDMFFLGVASAKQPGTTLTFPFRGTTIGLFFAMDLSYGTFYASVDGGLPVEVITNNRGGYTYQVFASNLTPGEHILTVVLPKDVSGPVKLGYALVAGETGAPLTRATQGSYSADVLRQLDFRSLKASAWTWIGPFGDQPNAVSGLTSDFNTAWIPEDKPTNQLSLTQSYPGMAGKTLDWKPLTGDSALIDFAQLTGLSDDGICYAAAEIQASQAGSYMLRFAVDYYAKIWINGVLIKTIDSGHGAPKAPLLIPVELKAGANSLLVKVHSGSAGNNFSLAVQTKQKALPDGEK